MYNIFKQINQLYTCLYYIIDVNCTILNVCKFLFPTQGRSINVIDIIVYPTAVAMPQCDWFSSVVYFVVHHSKHKINMHRVVYS